MRVVLTELAQLTVVRRTISNKAREVGGGPLEAVLSSPEFEVHRR
jgi:hypothetical protein